MLKPFYRRDAEDAVKPTLSKHFRIHLCEKRVMQTSDHLGRIVFFNHEGQINFGSTL